MSFTAWDSVPRAQARQLVLHGHIHVKGHKVDIPSYLVTVGDDVVLKEKMHQNAMILEARNLTQSQGVTPWLDIDREHFKARVVALPRARMCRRRRSTNS